MYSNDVQPVYEKKETGEMKCQYQISVTEYGEPVKLCMFIGDCRKKKNDVFDYCLRDSNERI